MNKRTNIVKDIVFTYIDNFNRLSEYPYFERYNFHDIILSVLYILYGIHRGYKIPTENQWNDKVSFNAKDDELLNLLEVSYTRHMPGEPLYRLYESLSNISKEVYNSSYVEVLQDIFAIDLIKGKKNKEFYTPENVTKLIADILNKEKCQSIFDPFCGTASIVKSITDKDIYFAGQEIQKEIILYAKLMLNACDIPAYKISNVNSIIQWNDNHFDAVVSCPPFKMPISQDLVYDLESEFGEEEVDTTKLLFYRAIKRNRADIIISLEPLSFCFSRQQYKLREILIEKNLLDAIYFLPEKILYETSIPCVLVVCKKNREEKAPVKFYNAQSFSVDSQNGDRLFDVDHFLNYKNSKNTSVITKVELDEIAHYDYNLNLAVYENHNKMLKEGQSVQRLGKLLVSAKYTNIAKDEIENLVSQSLLSRDIIKILLNANRLFNDGTTEFPRLYKCEKGEGYLIYNPGIYSTSKFGLISEPCKFVCSRALKVMKINTEKVSPEYLAYILLNSEALKRSYMPLSDCLKLPVVVDNLEEQRNIISSIKLEYAETMKAEQLADAQRLGVKQNISDIEHMLSSTTMKIDRIIYRLEKMTPDSPDYQKSVKELKDRFEYMKRTIHYSNENLDDAVFNLEKGNIVEFINAYADSWDNYGGRYFDLTIKNDLIDSVNCAFDSAMLTVMLDSVLSNAVRHSFNKEKKHTEHNMVEIGLSLVAYQERPYMLMSIANNGDPLKAGFTIKDYITKGRYSGKMGRSGLGGYHVYKIAKGHNGFIFLDSNKVWSLIVEILIPVESIEVSNLIEYEHECI